MIKQIIGCSLCIPVILYSLSQARTLTLPDSPLGTIKQTTSQVAMMPTQTTSFRDTISHTYGVSIEFLRARNIVNGYSDGTFKPNQPISRAELLKIVLNAGSGEIGHLTRCFIDVQSERFAPYICYAQSKAIVQGYDDGTFKPNQHITVAESIKIAIRSFGVPVEQVGKDERYVPYLDFVHDNNLFSKYGLSIDTAMTRGQMAFLVHQLILHKDGGITSHSINNYRSAGCGKEPPQDPPTASSINGTVRHYITDIGSEYNKDIPTKLIIAFHGRTNPNSMVRTYYDIDKASKGNAIIVYPAGLPEEGPSRSRSNPGDKANSLRDFALFDQLVNEFSSNYCIHKDQVFVVGHSLGAWFTNSLACARGDVIRAIGSVGGGTTINNCNGPTAAIIMHRPHDALTPYKEGLKALDQLLKQNSCGPETKPTGPEGGNCVEYTHCQDGTSVVRCPHSDSYEGTTYYTHTRPDFAGQAIWDFFMEQR